MFFIAGNINQGHQSLVTFGREENVILLVFQPCHLLRIQQSNCELNCHHGMSDPRGRRLTLPKCSTKQIYLFSRHYLLQVTVDSKGIILRLLFYGCVSLKFCRLASVSSLIIVLILLYVSSYSSTRTDDFYDPQHVIVLIFFFWQPHITVSVKRLVTLVLVVNTCLFVPLFVLFCFVFFHIVQLSS